MPLFEVALIKHPTKKEREDGGMETLVMEPTAVLARDQQSAGVSAVVQKSDEIKDDMARVEVLVRPFA